MNIHNSLKKIIARKDLQKKRYERIRRIVILLSVFFVGIFIGNLFTQNPNFSITGFATGALPTVGGDSGNWGTVLNNYLSQEHTSTGGHKNVTIEGDLNVSGNFNVTGNTNLTGNLTLGEKITFAFGEIIDNLMMELFRLLEV